MDQYRVRTDKRSGIVNDPNPADDETYIVDLIQKVIGVSLETVGLLRSCRGWILVGRCSIFLHGYFLTVGFLYDILIRRTT